MEESQRVWKEESGGNHVWDAEGAIHQEPEVEETQKAAVRTTDRGDSSQHRATELPRMRWEVTFHRAAAIERLMYIIFYINIEYHSVRKLNSTNLLPVDVMQFINGVKPYCSSIYLGGSWATQNADSNSDIDFCLISAGTSQKKTILEVVRGTLQILRNKRLLLDVKVYTQKEFDAAIQGIQNPYWYTFFRDGIRLFGEEVEVPLLHHTFTNSVWQSIEQVQESLSYIEQRILLDIVCYQLWTAMSLVFTVDCLIHNGLFRKNSRVELAHRFFEHQHNHIRKEYERVGVLRRAQIHSGLSLIDKQSIKYNKAISAYTEIDVEALRKGGLRVLSYCERVYRQIIESE